MKLPDSHSGHVAWHRKDLLLRVRTQEMYSLPELSRPVFVIVMKGNVPILAIACVEQTHLAEGIRELL